MSIHLLLCLYEYVMSQQNVYLMLLHKVQIKEYVFFLYSLYIFIHTVDSIERTAKTKIEITKILKEKRFNDKIYYNKEGQGALEKKTKKMT